MDLRSSAFRPLLGPGEPTRECADKVAGSSTGAIELAKRALWAEQQATRQAELPAARAKLDRLIESRAQARAEEMYAERRRLELEAVKAEMLGDP